MWDGPRILPVRPLDDDEPAVRRYWCVDTQHASARRAAQTSAETPMGAVGLCWMVRPMANANNLSYSSRVIHDWTTTPSSSRRYQCKRLLASIILDIFDGADSIRLGMTSGGWWLVETNGDHWPRGYKKTARQDDPPTTPYAVTPSTGRWRKRFRCVGLADRCRLLRAWCFHSQVMQPLIDSLEFREDKVSGPARRPIHHLSAAPLA